MVVQSEVERLCSASSICSRQQRVATRCPGSSASCALQCAKSGFGIVTADGNYLKFDDAGNSQVLAALKATKKADHLRVSVTGDRAGDTIKVSAVRIE